MAQKSSSQNSLIALIVFVLIIAGGGFMFKDKIMDLFETPTVVLQKTLNNVKNFNSYKETGTVEISIKSPVGGSIKSEATGTTEYENKGENFRDTSHVSAPGGIATDTEVIRIGNDFYIKSSAIEKGLKYGHITMDKLTSSQKEAYAKSLFKAFADKVSLVGQEKVFKKADKTNGSYKYDLDCTVFKCSKIVADLLGGQSSYFKTEDSKLSGSLTVDKAKKQITEFTVSGDGSFSNPAAPGMSLVFSINYKSGYSDYGGSFNIAKPVGEMTELEKL